MEFNIHQLDPHLMDAKTSSVVIFVDILPALTLELSLVNPMLHPGIVDVWSRVVGLHCISLYFGTLHVGSISRQTICP